MDVLSLWLCGCYTCGLALKIPSVLQLKSYEKIPTWPNFEKKIRKKNGKRGFGRNVISGGVLCIFSRGAPSSLVAWSYGFCMGWFCKVKRALLAVTVGEVTHLLTMYILFFETWRKKINIYNVIYIKIFLINFLLFLISQTCHLRKCKCT